MSLPNSLPIRDRKIAPLPQRYTRRRDSSTNSESQSNETKENIEPKLQGLSGISHLPAAIELEASSPPVPYDIRVEKTPNEPFYTEKFQSALQNGIKVAQKALSGLESACTLIGDTRLRDLEASAEGLSQYRCIESRTIALLGDSGEGKSSLINSLLHCPNIASTGDLGSARTSVVTEFRQRTAQHTAPIALEVEYLNSDEMKELIEELVWSYRKLYLPSADSAEVSAAEYQKMERESEVARCALDSAFADKQTYNQQLLRDMSDGAAERIITMLLQWTEDIQWPNGGDISRNGLWKSTAQTADEVCGKTEAFMKDRLWPFTKIIRIYLDSPVLKTGIILADLPGLQDTNLARVQATHDYLLRCDHIFIIAKISRAITDQSLRSSLYQVLSKHVPLEWEKAAGRYLNVAVICTRSEEINEPAAMKEFCGPGKRILPQSMEEIDRNIQTVKLTGDSKRKKRYKRQRSCLLIEARNSHVKENLQRAYAEKVPGGILEVFCVSNTLYQKYTRKDDRLMIRASGIPALRSFCYSITAQKQLLEAKHFIETRLAVCLNSLDIWVQNNCQESPVALNLVAMAELQQSALAFLRTSTNKIQEAIRAATSSCLEAFTEQILQYTKRTEHWDRYAKISGDKWTSWHVSQYNAWCRNDGDHNTPKRGHVNWNQELIWKMRSELDMQWEILEEEIPVEFQILRNSLVSELQALQQHFAEIGLSSTVHQALKLQVETLDHFLWVAQQKYQRELRIIRRKASEGSYGSYMVKEMMPAYRSAATEGGIGMKSRQIRIVQGRIEDGTLFPNICFTIKAQFEKQTEKIMSQVLGETQLVLTRVKSDLEMALNQAPVIIADNRRREERKHSQTKLRLLAKTLVDEHKTILTDIA